jgi:hypothetical protein
VGELGATQRRRGVGGCGPHTHRRPERHVCECPPDWAVGLTGSHVCNSGAARCWTSAVEVPLCVREVHWRLRGSAGRLPLLAAPRHLRLSTTVSAPSASTKHHVQPATDCTPAAPWRRPERTPSRPPATQLTEAAPAPSHQLIRPTRPPSTVSRRRVGGIAGSKSSSPCVSPRVRPRGWMPYTHRCPRYGVWGGETVHE